MCIRDSAKRESGAFCIGTIFLVLGQLADITTPFYIGKVIDLIREEEFEEIKTWCAIQAGVVLVSITAPS